MVNVAQNVRAAILSEAEARGILAQRRAKQERADRYSPFYHWTPLKDQRAFIEDDESQVILYGGQVGGGKSVGLLMRGCRGVDHPAWSYLIIRKKMVDMVKPGGILDLARTAFRNTGAKWSEERQAFIFPSGASITFSPCVNLRDAQERFQGPAFTGGIGIDEAGLLPWEVMEWLPTRMRKPTDVPWNTTSLDLTANPQGICHAELVKHFGLDPENVSPELKRKGYRYIPASLYDNPYLDHKEYEKQFIHMPAEQREALLKGRWDVRMPGKYLSEQMFRLIEAKDAPLFDLRARVWDIGVTGETDPTASLLAAWDEETNTDYHLHRTHELLKAVDAREHIVKQALIDGPSVVQCIDDDNVSRTLVQDLVQNYGFIELFWDDKNVAVKANEAKAKKGLAIMLVPTKSRKKLERAEAAIHQYYAGNVVTVQADWTSEQITLLTRLSGRKDEHDEDLDLIGLAQRATRRLQTRVSEDGHAPHLPLTEEQIALAAEKKRRRKRLGLT